MQCIYISANLINWIKNDFGAKLTYRYKSLVRLELMLCLMFIYIVPQCFVSITTLKLFLIFRAQATAIMAFIELFEHSGK